MSCDPVKGCPSDTHNLHCRYPQCAKGEAQAPPMRSREEVTVDGMRYVLTQGEWFAYPEGASWRTPQDRERSAMLDRIRDLEAPRGESVAGDHAQATLAAAICGDFSEAIQRRINGEQDALPRCLCRPHPPVAAVVSEALRNKCAEEYMAASRMGLSHAQCMGVALDAFAALTAARGGA